MIIDLHTHILPGIDDGVATVEESILLLRAELEDGVDAVALTPHFFAGSESVGAFLSLRQEAFGTLCEAVTKEKLPIGMILGAEVVFSAALPELDLAPLCLGGTKTLLVELPRDYCRPYTVDVFKTLARKGYTPMIAHVERCPYIMRDPSLLEVLVGDGALAQVNADSLFLRDKTQKRVLSLIFKGLVKVVATDTHGIENRPPALMEALNFVRKKTGKDMALAMLELGARR